MIKADQPICFPDDVLVAVSSKSDNTMLDRGRSFHEVAAVHDRMRFCELSGLSYGQCVFQLIQYNEEQTYSRMVNVEASDAVTQRDEVAGDGLFTADRGVGLFLPVADCTATVVYDPARQYIGLLHLGRHATCADLSTCAVKYFMERGSQAEDLIIWMSPGAKRETYSVDYFEYENNSSWKSFYEKRDDKFYLDLPGYNKQRFIDSGVRPDSIYVSHVNTMTDPNYFSHRGGDVNGRIAIVAMMK